MSLKGLIKIFWCELVDSEMMDYSAAAFLYFAWRKRKKSSFHGEISKAGDLGSLTI